MKTSSLLLAIIASSSAFVAPQARRLVAQRVGCSPKAPFQRQTTPWNPASTATVTTTSSTSRRYMGFNLPPSGGGGKDNASELIGGVVTIVALVAFFVSPLGGIFFTIFNSFVALAFITPVLLFVAFQTWQTFYTFDGPCPNCEATVKVLKDQQPTICLNCGAIVQSNANGNAIELAPQDGVIGNDPDSDSIESLLGSLMGFSEAAQPTKSTPEERQQKFRREQTIIDVEVDKD